MTHRLSPRFVALSLLVSIYSGCRGFSETIDAPDAGGGTAGDASGGSTVGGGGTGTTPVAGSSSNGGANAARGGSTAIGGMANSGGSVSVGGSDSMAGDNGGISGSDAGGAPPQTSHVDGDLNGDGVADIAMTGGLGWDYVLTAISQPNKTFSSVTSTLASFPALAGKVGARAVAGDFDGDGRADLALVGGADWTTIPIAFSNGDGNFTFANNTVMAMPAWSRVSGAKPVAGDFDGDGKGDIALTGGTNWDSVPVAFSKGDGTFRPVSFGLQAFPGWAQVSGALPVSGDFNGDGKGDIALTGGVAWDSVPVALSNGDGTFKPMSVGLALFPDWAQVSGAKPVAGDFDGDGKGDIALVGGSGVNSIPIAFSNGDGSFHTTNTDIPSFPSLARATGVLPVSGDFNGDGKGDIALVGGSNPTTVPVAFSNGDGSFHVTALMAGNFAQQERASGAKPVCF